MDLRGEEFWTRIRPVLSARGRPLKVLRRIAKDGRADLEGLFDAIVESGDDTGLVAALGSFSSSGDSADAALELLERLAEPGRRLPRPVAAVADALALRVFDHWAGMADNPGAEVSGHVIEALGTEVARMEFDRGWPGSGEVLSAWRLDGALFLVGDDGAAYGIHSDLAEVLRAWAEFSNAEIRCDGIERMDVELPDLEPGHVLRINGAEWVVATGGKLQKHRRAQHLDDADWCERHVAGRKGSRPPATPTLETTPVPKTTAPEHEARGDAHHAEKNDQAAVAEWRFAGAKGSPTAHWKLALAYCRGRGVGRDVFEAARRCQAAAEWGHPRAAVRMAHAYRGLIKFTLVDRWLRRAWEGDPEDRPPWASRPFPTVESTANAEALLREAAESRKRRARIAWIAFLVAHGRVDDARAFWAGSPAGDALKVDEGLLLELSGAREALGLTPVAAAQNQQGAEAGTKASGSVIPFRPRRHAPEPHAEESELPPYLGLGALDQASVITTPEGLRARYVCGDDPVYDVLLAPAECCITEFWEGAPIGQWTGTTFAEAFFASLPRQPEQHPRFAQMRGTVEAMGVTIGTPGATAYFPAGFVYQLTVPVVDRTRSAWSQLRARLARQGAVVLEREYRAALLLATASGEITAEHVLGVEIVSILRDLPASVEMLSRAGLVPTEAHYTPVALSAPTTRHVYQRRDPHDNIVAFTLLPLDPPEVSVAAACAELRNALPDLPEGSDPPEGLAGGPAYAPGARVFIPGGGSAVVSKDVRALLEFCRAARMDLNGDPATGDAILTRLLESGTLKSVHEPIFAEVLEVAAPSRADERRHLSAPWRSIVRVRLETGSGSGLAVWTLDSFFTRPVQTAVN